MHILLAALADLLLKRLRYGARPAAGGAREPAQAAGRRPAPRAERDRARGDAPPARGGSPRCAARRDVDHRTTLVKAALSFSGELERRAGRPGQFTRRWRPRTARGARRSRSRTTLLAADARRRRPAHRDRADEAAEREAEEARNSVRAHRRRRRSRAFGGRDGSQRRRRSRRTGSAIFRGGGQLLRRPAQKGADHRAGAEVRLVDHLQATAKRVPRGRDAFRVIRTRRRSTIRTVCAI